MEDKERIEKLLGAINLKELDELITKTNESNKLFKERYREFVTKYAGKIVAITPEGKIAHIPFTPNITEAKKNFESLEKKIGKENMSTATISYIPKPGKILLL